VTAISCPICGAGHGLGSSHCRKPLVGRILRAGIRVREVMGETPLGPHYRAEYPNGSEVAVLVLGSSAEYGFRTPGLQPAKIQHANIAAVHDLNETDDGLVYAVTEPLTGEFLSVTLARRGTLPQSEALDLCLQAAAGLQAAHGVGWIHGRLSPRTILLVRIEGRPQVKLIGFAHQFALRQSRPESPVDEGMYASPERIPGHRLDERSDVFSLGAVLHHLLTGAPPKRGSRSGRVPKRIRPVLDRALAPSPADRFQTIAEFAAMLAPLLTEAKLTDSADNTTRGVHIEEAGPSKEEDLSLPLPASRPARPAWRRRVAVGVAAVMVAAVAGLWLSRATQRPSVNESFSALARLPTDSGELAVGQHQSGTALIPTDTVLRTSDSRPSQDSGPAAGESPLVDVQSVDSTIQVDLRYATADNFTGAPLPGYEAQRALLLPEVATALGRVQARLRRNGMGLRVFDAYRPLRATRAMANWAQRAGRRELFNSGFIGRRSQHNLGVAVDVTLVDLETGNEVSNPDILSRAMKSEGFSTLHQASYHFVYELDGAMPLDRVIR
jgi:D-alanyl-D-alanine dipeptidase